MSVFVIAEAGVNHNGSVERALQLVEVAARCGADAVKFQTFSAAKLVTRGAAKAEYQKAATGQGDQYDMLRALELDEEAHRALFARCTELGIEFMSTPFDVEAAAFLVGLGMRRLKIPSGEITNEPFLESLAATGRPLILSTGMADMAEIRRAVEVIGAARPARSAADLVVLHCTSNYPTRAQDANLRAMTTTAAETGLPVGYSDHTLGINVALAAVALGATVIEKHFTLDRSLPGPDHAASLEPADLQRMVAGIREIESALGSPLKAPVAAELPVRDVARRSVTLLRDVAAGARLEAADLGVLRPGTGIAPRHLRELAGRRLHRALPAGTTLQWTDLE